MKIQKLVIITMLILTCWLSYAATVKLEWCPSPDATVVGYTITYGEGNMPGWKGQIIDTNFPPCPGVLLYPGTNWFRNYTTNVDVGLVTSTVISNLVEGKTYYIAIKAFDTNGLKSDPSNEVEYKVPLTTNSPPSQPQNFRFSSPK